MSTGISQVGPAFAELVRRRELAVAAPSEHARIKAQLDDTILRPLLDEQLRECVFSFAQLAQPTGSRIVSGRGLDPLMAHTLFEQVPVLADDQNTAASLACHELRRLAALNDNSIPGATLALCPNGDVIVQPVMQMRMGI